MRIAGPMLTIAIGAATIALPRLPTTTSGDFTTAIRGFAAVQLFTLIGGVVLVSGVIWLALRLINRD